MQFESLKVNLPLKKKFAISKGEASVKTNLITILNNRYNGEASGSVHYGPEIGLLENDIARGGAFIEEQSDITLDTLDQIGQLKIHPAAQAALVGMSLNYISGESRRYPWEVLGLGSPVGVKSSFTIALDKTGDMIESAIKAEYPILKIKMGVEQDVMLLDLFSRLNNKTIRVDANGGWSCAKAEEMIFNLAKHNIKIIEQPTDIEFIEEWPNLKGNAENVELILDEGLNSLDDYEKYAKYVDGVNIKMEKCGGIKKGVEIARRAREDGKKVMMGCMVSSSIGIAQSVYMSSLADYFDLDGPLLIEDDIALGVSYDRESINVDREIIGGPKLKRDILKRYIN